MREEIELINRNPKPYKLYGTVWKPNGKAKAVIHVVHGMTEHIGRYDKFAEAMNKEGIAVVGFDLRGHGRNATRYSAAIFVDGGWRAALSDLRLEMQYVKENFPDTKYCLMGFSLGSFLVRDMMRHPILGVNAIILAGTGYQPPATLSLLTFITKWEKKRTPVGVMSNLTKSLAFDTYNKKFGETKTPMDWLCSDEEQLQVYLNDPLVHKAMSTELFHEMLMAMKRTCATNAYKHSNWNIPVHLISGEQDAVGNMGSGVRKLHDIMCANGFNANIHMVPNARHDIFHECTTQDEMPSCAQTVFETVANIMQ